MNQSEESSEPIEPVAPSAPIHPLDARRDQPLHDRAGADSSKGGRRDSTRGGHKPEVPAPGGHPAKPADGHVDELA